MDTRDIPYNNQTINDESVISLENIAQGYGDKRVLADISYNFQKNKITAILGKSGSGKTTLLQTINGMVKPKSGIVKLFGQPIRYESIHATRLKIGYVVQNIGLFPHLTIQKNMSVLAHIAKAETKSIVARINYLMDLVQLPSTYLMKYPHQLSGGEQQRVGLCRAMFLNPPVLLMDEPFASLDDETKGSIFQDMLKSQKNEPRTVVLITHNKQEALTLADYFVWLREGKIVRQGDKEQLKQLLSENIDL
ncbi:ATP-binding cassette domain-containing protein [Chryseolinea sp. H1M3-3]|uniref:ATP-binding cassette domain-containing protein n=1 Tax=Chryseolinea sp. H1M3-3 TaxID=3034144 RepID=UPI0023EAFC58|nr:ATP-binding cassette domain-containing protein [Chryseolinea sp. H1M3-3]